MASVCEPPVPDRLKWRTMQLPSWSDNVRICHAAATCMVLCPCRPLVAHREWHFKITKLGSLKKGLTDFYLTSCYCPILPKSNPFECGKAVTPRDESKCRRCYMQEDGQGSGDGDPTAGGQSGGLGIQAGRGPGPGSTSLLIPGTVNRSKMIHVMGLNQR